MKIIAVDDETRSLNTLKAAIEKAIPNVNAQYFKYAPDALSAVENGFFPDIAFLDVEMPDMSGLVAARRLKSISPEINIIFVSGFPQYAMDAIHLRASGYILKPACAENIKAEIQNLRNPIKDDMTKKLKIRTFQNFDVFKDGKLVEFNRSKSKEILAYLVDRGGTSASYSEIAAILWEDGIYDRSRQKQIQVYIHGMIKNLAGVGADDVIIKNRLGIAIDTEKVDCDSYRFMQGDTSAINSYRGEYMSAYSWAEFANAAFLKMSNI